METNPFLVFSSNLHAGLQHPAPFPHHLDIYNNVRRFQWPSPYFGSGEMVTFNRWAYIAIFRGFPDLGKGEEFAAERRAANGRRGVAGVDLLLKDFSGRGHALRGAPLQARQRKFSPVYGRHRRRPCRDTGPRPSWSQRSWLLTTSIPTVPP